MENIVKDTFVSKWMVNDKTLGDNWVHNTNVNYDLEVKNIAIELITHLNDDTADNIVLGYVKLWNVLITNVIHQTVESNHYTTINDEMRIYILTNIVNSFYTKIHESTYFIKTNEDDKPLYSKRALAFSLAEFVNITNNAVDIEWKLQKIVDVIAVFKHISDFDMSHLYTNFLTTNALSMLNAVRVSNGDNISSDDTEYSEVLNNLIKNIPSDSISFNTLFNGLHAVYLDRREQKSAVVEDSVDNIENTDDEVYENYDDSDVVTENQDTEVVEVNTDYQDEEITS